MRQESKAQIRANLSLSPTNPSTEPCAGVLASAAHNDDYDGERSGDGKRTSVEVQSRDDEEQRVEYRLHIFHRYRHAASIFAVTNDESKRHVGHDARRTHHIADPVAQNDSAKYQHQKESA